MKRIIQLIVITAFVPIFSSIVNAEKREGIAVSNTAAAVNFTQSIDVSNFDRFSVQAIYSDGTPASHSVTSGSRASATITIGNNPTGLIGAQASLTVNVSSVAGVSGDSVVLNGVVFKEGTDWTAATSTTVSAANLATKIDAHSDFSATSSGSTVTVKYAAYGSSGNGLPATTTDSTYLKLSAATFGSGINRNTITINGTVLTEGVDFNANASSATIGHNLVVAINANSTLNVQVIASSSSATPGIVTVKALYPGYSNYSLVSSTAGFTTSSGFPGGAPSEVDPSTDIISQTAHALTTGLKVLLVTTAGTAPTGLTTGTTYFAINLNENQYALATTSTTAVAGTKIDITGITDNATTDIRPLALSAAANTGFYWSASNDNSNFTNLSNVTYSSVTYTAAGNSLYDFGEFGYKYLRMVFTGPTNGGIALSAKIYGKEE